MDWAEVAAAAATESGSPGAELLGDFLPRLAEASGTGNRIGLADLARFRALGAQAADQGVAFATVIDLYLSAAWRAWRHLPPVAADDPEAIRRAGEIVLHAVDDTVVAVGDGHAAARRAAVRLEVSNRREFVDDLLTGTGDPMQLLDQAEGFGLDLAGSHAVAVVRGARPIQDTSPRLAQATAALIAAGSSDFLITTRHGALVAVLPGTAPVEALPRQHQATVAVGRTHPGAAGVTRSYEEALDTLDLADRLGLRDPVVRADQLLVYRVLIRDREAITDLIDAVLEPLRSARGGARPLLDTIDAYVDSGAVATIAARRLHLSVRAVTYRLRRIHQLTGYQPTRPQDRFVLHAALLGARALGWPDDPPP